jgi:hypothetical protein
MNRFAEQGVFGVVFLEAFVSAAGAGIIFRQPAASRQYGERC